MYPVTQIEGRLNSSKQLNRGAGEDSSHMFLFRSGGRRYVGAGGISTLMRMTLKQARIHRRIAIEWYPRGARAPQDPGNSSREATRTHAPPPRVAPLSAQLRRSLLVSSSRNVVSRPLGGCPFSPLQFQMRNGRMTSDGDTGRP